MDTRLQWADEMPAEDRINAMRFGETDLVARERILLLAEREVSRLSDQDLTEILSLAVVVPYAFDRMQREYYEGVRRVVEKRRQVVAPIVPECERAAFDAEVLEPALQSIFWIGHLAEGVNTDRMLEFIDGRLGEDLTVAGAALVCAGRRYPTIFSHAVEAKRFLANYLVSRPNTRSNTYVWPTVDKKPWYRNEAPAWEDDRIVKLLAVTDACTVIVRLRIDQLPHCLTGRRAFYAYDMDTYADLEEIYPYSYFGVVVRDDGVEGIPVYGEENGLYFFSRVSTKKVEVPVGQLLAKFPISAPLMRMVFFNANYGCWSPSFNQLSVIVRHQLDQCSKLVVVGYAPNGSICRYGFYRGKTAMIKNVDEVKAKNTTIFVTSRPLLWEFQRSTQHHQLGGWGVELSGYVDISPLAEGQTIFQTCSMIMKAAKYDQVVFFTHGTTLFGQVREPQSARPLTVLGGESEPVEWVNYYRTEEAVPYADPDEALMNVEVLYAVARSLVNHSGWVEDNVVQLSSIKAEHLVVFLSSTEDLEITESELSFSGDQIERLQRSDSLERFLVGRRYESQVHSLIEELGVLVSATNWVNGNLRGLFLRRFFVSYCKPVLIGSTLFHIAIRPNIAQPPEAWLRQLMDAPLRNHYDETMLARPNLRDVKMSASEMFTYLPLLYCYDIESTVFGEWKSKNRRPVAVQGALPSLATLAGVAVGYGAQLEAILDYLNSHLVG